MLDLVTIDLRLHGNEDNEKAGCDETRGLNKLPADLLAWFDRHGRDLPWRTALGERRDPYRVWLAEIMLQQTTIPHGTPYFLSFTQRWPTVEALAAAKDEEVMTAWAGLGYYARARNLLKCAREVAERGSWPETAAELKKLPGIGPYTAGAIAAIAFNQPAAAVDGNVDRVFARLLALKGDWAQEKKRLHKEVERLVPGRPSGGLCRSADGPRRDRVHADKAELPDLPGFELLPRPSRRRTGALPHQAAEEGQAHPARCGLCGGS
jgi:endonuclease III